MAISEIPGPPSPVFSPLPRRYTLEEFWALAEPEERAHYELIGGYLFMVPPPDPPHGDVVARLTSSLTVLLHTRGVAGAVYHPREGIYFDDTYLEPDMMYVSEQLREKMGSRRTSADIVFEFLSKTTASYDRTTKADSYLALGVLELWLVDPETKSIEIRNRGDIEGSPVWHSRRYGAGELALSQVLTDWRVSVDQLFAGL